MIENTVRRMREEGRDVAALVTGGYHTAGLTALLKSAVLRILVILPKFDPSKGERPYVTILTNKRQPYEPLLKAGTFYIATNAYFARDSHLSPAERKEIYVRDFASVVAEVVASAADDRERAAMKEDLFNLWSGAYRKAYGEFRAEQARRLAANEPQIDFIPETPSERDALLREIVGLKEGAAVSPRRLGGMSAEELLALYDDLGGDNLNKAHVKRVSDYAVIVARELGLGDDQVAMLGRLGVAHDISGYNERASTIQDQLGASKAIIRSYGFTPAAPPDAALRELDAFLAKRPELAKYRLSDDAMFHVSIARVLAAACAADGRPLAEGQMEHIISDISHERSSIDFLRSRGIELSPVEAYLIANHLHHPRDFNDLPGDVAAALKAGA